MCMVQRVGKEIFLFGKTSFNDTASYGIAVSGIDYYCIVAACCDNASKLLVCLGLTASHLNESRSDYNTLVAFTCLEVLEDFKAHSGTLRVGVVCIVKNGYAVGNFHRETVLYGLQAGYCVVLLVRRHAKAVGYGYRCKYVEQITGTKQAGSVLLASVDSKRYSTCSVIYIRCLVFAFILHCISDDTASACNPFIVSYVLRVVVYYSQSVGRQGVYELEFGVLYVLNAFECFKMHLSYSGYNTDSRVYQVAYLLDVVLLFCSHLHNEYLMIGAELLTDCAYHSKQGVEVTGGYKNVVFLGKHACKVVLCACLSETACYAYDDEPLVRFDDSFSIVVVVSVDCLLDRSVEHVGKQHEHVREEQFCTDDCNCPFAGKENCQCGYCNEEQYVCRKQPLYSHCIYQRCLELFVQGYGPCASCDSGSKTYSPIVGEDCRQKHQKCKESVS